MSFLCIGDPHFGPNNADETDALQERILTIISNLKSEGPLYGVVMGDLINDNDKADLGSHTRASNFLMALQGQLTHLYVLIGNHDLAGPLDFLSGQHFFTLLRLWERTTLVDQPRLENIAGQNYVFCPYVPPGRFKEALRKVVSFRTRADTCEPTSGGTTLETKSREELPRMGSQGSLLEAVSQGALSKVKSREELSRMDPSETLSETMSPRVRPSITTIRAIFAHQEFRGSCTNDRGDHWSGRYPPVFSGHIHDYKILTFPSEEGEVAGVIYIGTPLQCNYDENPRKTVSLLTFPPGERFVQRRIRTRLLRKCLIDITLADLETWTLPANSKVKLRIQATKGEWKTFRNSERYRDLLEQGVIVIPGIIQTQTTTEKIALRREIQRTDAADYSTLFYQAVQDREDLRDGYIRLFGPKRGE